MGGAQAIVGQADKNHNQARNAPGDALFCAVQTAIRDGAKNAVMDPRERLNAEIIQVQSLSPSVVGLRMRCADPAFSWLPGQHIELGVHGTEALVSYSISSAEDPAEPGVFEVAASIRGNSFLSGAQQGHRLWVTRAQGSFVRARHSGSALFIAVGTGITPLRAMLQSEFLRRAPSVEPDAGVLIFGCRREEEILFRAEFEALANQYQRFRFIPTLTEPSAAWQGARGRVQAHVAQAFAQQLFVQAYICGTPGMAEATNQELLLLGMAPNTIHAQSY